MMARNGMKGDFFKSYTVETAGSDKGGPGGRATVTTEATETRYEVEGDKKEGLIGMAESTQKFMGGANNSTADQFLAQHQTKEAAKYKPGYANRNPSAWACDWLGVGPRTDARDVGFLWHASSSWPFATAAAQTGFGDAGGADVFGTPTGGGASGTSGSHHSTFREVSPSVSRAVTPRAHLAAATRGLSHWAEDPKSSIACVSPHSRSWAAAPPVA